MDFLTITVESVKKGVQRVVPKFKIRKSKDLMIRGKDFYAIWDEANKVWATDQDTAIRLIDEEIARVTERTVTDDKLYPMFLHDSSSGMMDRWIHYCKTQMEDNYHQLDQKLIFQNTDVKREDYSSKRLPYSLLEGDISAYDELMSVLYSEDERRKLEWAIGSIVSGDSKKIQKFIVLTGDAGTGKSTVIKIIQELFYGYTAAIDAKAIGSSQAAFALEPLKCGPLVAYQDDADLTRLTDNTRLNSLVSHERISVNEKFKSPYETAFNCFIFLGSNGDVRITDARSGIQRRLIDVRPTGIKLPFSRYLELMDQIDFELGAIAYHCLHVYKKNRHFYDNYTPMQSLRTTNPFYNFMEENYFEFNKLSKTEGVTLNTIWNGYKTYCDNSGLLYRLNRIEVKNEAMAYFKKFVADSKNPDGTHVRSTYYYIRPEKFGMASDVVEIEETKPWLKFDSEESILNLECADCPAQLANKKETPSIPWDDVVTKLNDIDTGLLHYVRLPENYIVIDFDLKDENGNKNFKLNQEAASKWPPTYAELSKSGSGIHLHYIYSGDVTKLEKVFDKDIEIKTFTGNASLRRKLTRCNGLSIAPFTGRLPLKGGKKVVNFEGVKNDKMLIKIIEDCLEKKHHGYTKPEIDLIFASLEDAYNRGLKYDVTRYRQAVLNFASKSTHQAKECLKIVNKMHFKSDEPSEGSESEVLTEAPIIFFDVEVFPNLLVVCWKKHGGGTVNTMINPTPMDLDFLIKNKLIGFNNRRYDNHIIYARWIGHTIDQIYELSQNIIKGSKNSMFGEAYNLSYTDIYDFSSKKQSLKKWEIELGIHHKELGMPWDMPVPEEMFDEVASYCKNDVEATEAVFNHIYPDFVAREILSDLAGMTVNDTTNTLTGKIIFGNDKKPQDKFVYTDLSTIFPGYKYEHGKSEYMGEDPGEGGYVYAEPGMYGNVALLDVASMHPTSIEQLNLFGPYTEKFSELKKARIAIKHKDYETAGKMFDGKLAKYLTNDEQADSLAYALKIAINSVYGLTSAKFDNKFRDPRNVDNIVAKRGALFMINLKHEVQSKGYCVAHIKTDSIKIPDADKEIISFVMEYGKKYGYEFEHEATYDKMCLVNNAVYIARYAKPEKCIEMYNYIPSDNKKHPYEWSATGAQFQQPYVFKTLFTKDQILFDDLCETRAVSAGELYLDMNEDLSENEHAYHYVGKVGRFCPIKPGQGGGILYRRKDDKDYAATNTTGFRWMESEMVKQLGKEADIDKSFYRRLSEAAKDDISKYGSFDWFVSDEEYDGAREELPFN